MTIPSKPLAEVTDRAIHVLTREIGVADTMRFLNQFITGSGNYTYERDELFSGLDLDALLGEVRRTRPS